MTDQDELNYGLNGSPTQVQKIFPPETNDKKEIWNGSGDMLAKKLFDKVEELKFV
jgi:electron transfer flavoprotein beta subunit